MRVEGVSIDRMKTDSMRIILALPRYHSPYTYSVRNVETAGGQMSREAVYQIGCD